MITAGIDSGIENTKIVILKDGNVIARGTAATGGAGRGKNADQLWESTLKQAKLSASDVANVVATGQGKWDVHNAKDAIVETTAETKAALMLFPQARSLINAGADQLRAVKFDSGGKILEYALNQKCAAGLGLFLESQAKLLEMTIEQLDKPVAGSNGGVVANDQCGVFAELDVVSLIHDNVPKNEIVRAIHEAVAARLNSLANELNLDKPIVFLGGLALNQGVLQALEKRSGMKFLVPDYPEYAGALGAALIAAG
jgi:predicted CoA-substrate-specific enzyme activase